ncbi:MAG: hypothetical protein AAGD04_13765 [Pseudomonadota bacterium]
MPQRMHNICFIASFSLFASALNALAGGVTVERATAKAQGDSYRFDVTLSHADTGWDHYADAWEVRLEDGTVLGTRTLLHPHVNEQPFTRSLGGVVVPKGQDTVLIFAHDSQHGWTTAGFRLDLNSTK